MKILIVSDTHRKDGNLQWVMEKEKPFDMLIHLGDAEGSEQYIAHWAEPGCELEMVLETMTSFPIWSGNGIL